MAPGLAEGSAVTKGASLADITMHAPSAPDKSSEESTFGELWSEFQPKGRSGAADSSW